MSTGATAQPTTPPRLTRRLQLIGGIAALIGLAIFFASHYEALAQAIHFRPGYLILIALGACLNTLCRALTLHAPYSNSIGHSMKLRHWWAVGVVASFLNLIFLPNSGVAYRSIYLKDKAKIPILETILLQGINFLFASSFALLVISLVALSIGAERTGMDDANLLPSILISTAILFILHVGLLAIPNNGSHGIYGILSALRRAKKLFTQLKSFTQYFIANILTLGLMAVVFWAAFRSMSIDITPYQCLILGVTLTASTLASITPGNIGISEALAGIVGAATGVAPEAAVSAAVVVRIINVTCLMMLAGGIWHNAHRKPTNAPLLDRTEEQ